MARFLVTAEVVTTVLVEVEADGERAAHDSVLGAYPGTTLEEATEAGRAGSPSYGDLTVRTWHRFDRDKVKNIIPRLSDEDADAIVALADSAFREGARGVFPDAAALAETDWWPANDGGAISRLNDRLQLDGNEIEDIYGEAFSAGSDE